MAAGYTSGTQRSGGSGGGLSNQPPVGTTGGSGTQAPNHPVTGLSDSEGTPYPNSPPSFSAEGSEQVGSFGNNVVHKVMVLVVVVLEVQTLLNHTHKTYFLVRMVVKV